MFIVKPINFIDGHNNADLYTNVVVGSFPDAGVNTIQTIAPRSGQVAVHFDIVTLHLAAHFIGGSSATAGGSFSIGMTFLAAADTRSLFFHNYRGSFQFRAAAITTDNPIMFLTN